MNNEGSAALLEDAKEILTIDYQKGCSLLGIELYDDLLRYFKNARLLSEWSLKALSDTHVLVANPETPVATMERLSSMAYLLDTNAKNYAALGKRGERGWYLLRKDLCPGSAGKTLQEQKALQIVRTDELPTAQELVYAMAACWLLTGKELYQNTVVRTSSFISHKTTIAVGFLGGRIKLFHEVPELHRCVIYQSKYYPLCATFRRIVSKGSRQLVRLT